MVKLTNTKAIVILIPVLFLGSLLLTPSSAEAVLIDYHDMAELYDDGGILRATVYLLMDNSTPGVWNYDFYFHSHAYFKRVSVAGGSSVREDGVIIGFIEPDDRTLTFESQSLDGLTVIDIDTLEPGSLTTIATDFQGAYDYVWPGQWLQPWRLTYYQEVPVHHILASGSPNADGSVPSPEVPSPVPEPGTLLLLGSGIVGTGLMLSRRRKKRS